ncbi:TIGR00341 family protein [Agarivorans sp. 1_MG-2023]|uniref:TIGR00341 family protein n=1 Tax=Agarivorans sp. 1_MG-2023 TaxID=3062634 RepID=UPI0026E26890|nr:TIGR00341 family protein [Agarivorans sp. 1_MG-2023]MDO6765574.1 TIGR00341 family protein [Agarivorans sp. 1_MG-2023]
MADSFLLFEPDATELVSQKIQPLFESVVLPKSWDCNEPPEWEAGSIVYCYLSDKNLSQVIDLASSQQWVVAILPHPKASHAKRAFSLANSLDKAVQHVQQAEVVQIDVLRCNQEVVLNHLVVGHSFNLRPGGHNASWRQRILQTWQNIRKIGQIKPQKLTITTASETCLETSLVGLVLIEHAHGSMLSKQILTDTHCNDGMLESMLIAPRSIMEMFRFLLLAMFGRVIRKPRFLSLIKSKAITISKEQEMVYWHDGLERTAKALTLECEHKALSVLPAADMVCQENVVAVKESRKISHLPEGEAINALAARPLPWIAHAATDEFRELYQLLRDNATTSPAFVTLMVLSTLLATIGLYASSAPVIIGAMILAPLMAPIISLSMGLTRQDPSLTTASLGTLITGLCVALGFAASASFIIPMEVVTPEIAARLSPNLLDLGVAIISGIAGAYAHARIDAAKSLAGVAIAVALVPPLAVAGIGLGWLDASVASGALLLFLTNLAGIVFSAALTFLALGYAPFTRAKKGLAIALAAVVLVSVPLVFSFNRLSEEAQIVQRLQGKTFNEVLLRTVRAQSTKPLTLHVQLVSAKALSDQQLDLLKDSIQAELKRPFNLEASIIIRR